MSRSFCVVFITCRSRREALKISSSLLDKRLAACASLVPDVASKFHWQGRLCSAREVLITAKAKASDFKAIEKEVKRLHSYKVPEIIAVPVIAGSADYLEWINKETI